MDIFLQIFLLANVLLIGIGISFGIYYTVVHLKHPKDKDELEAEKAVKLSSKAREELIQQAEETYRQILENTSTRLIIDLEKTAQKLNSELDISGEKIIHDQMEQYKAQLSEIQKTTTVTSDTAVQEVTAYKDELQKKMQADIEAEKAKLIQQLDTRLADSVLAFLVETLQHDIDLGAQTRYLKQTLEEHKEEFKGKVNDER